MTMMITKNHTIGTRGRKQNSLLIFSFLLPKKKNLGRIKKKTKKEEGKATTPTHFPRHEHEEYKYKTL